MKEIKFNQSKDEKPHVLCSECKIGTRHTVIASVDVSGKEMMSEDDWFYYSTSYQIVKCDGCDSVSFRTEASNSEDYDYQEGTRAVSVILFPKRSIETWAPKEFFNVPYSLRSIYRETIDCFNNENLTLCGAGVRALVEGVCTENQITDGEIELLTNEGRILKRVESLQGRINGLAEKGKLTRENAEILHEHRFLGNEALHTLRAPSKEELTLALQIVEHVFDSLYEIPEKGSRLRHERQRSVKKKK